jgi:MerR family transcriptional regulator, copper efflux regulator
MTVGELARRTGLSIRRIREYERLGLIYSAGRSEANYRLFDEVALWCAGAVERLRSLGLTLAEIQELAALHRAGEEAALAQRMDALLEGAEARIEGRIAELLATRGRIRAFRAGSQRSGASAGRSAPLA